MEQGRRDGRERQWRDGRQALNGIMDFVKLGANGKICLIAIRPISGLHLAFKRDLYRRPFQLLLIPGGVPALTRHYLIPCPGGVLL
jgi:hypothetical protein